MYDQGEIRIVLADKSKFDGFVQIKQEESNVFWSAHDSKPTRAELEVSFHEQMQRETRQFYLLEVGDNVAGYLYVDNKTDGVELGYAVSEKYWGKGYGSLLVQQAVKRCVTEQITDIYAWIFQTNIGSIKVIKKNGFVETGRSKQRFLPALKKEVLFKEYRWNLNK